MKKMKISDASLEQFIKQFLPEGKLVHDERLELMSISKLIAKIFDTIYEHSTVEIVFNTFCKFRYPMSVVEPIRLGEKLMPYINTNSNAIYIALDLAKLSDIIRLSEILIENDLIIPQGLEGTYNSLMQF
jgi:hypothetical protein